MAIMDELHVPLTLEKLSGVNDSLACGKAPGSVGNLSRVLKAGQSSLLVSHLHELLLKCWEECFVPHDMCNA